LAAVLSVLAEMDPVELAQNQAKTVFARFSDGFWQFSGRRGVGKSQPDQALDRFRRATRG
jgi:hypothetical protein